jgi:hypothetical protein
MQFIVKRKAHKVALAGVDAAGALILPLRRETSFPMEINPSGNHLERNRL